MYPLIIVVSFGSKTPLEIIKNIIKVNGEDLNEQNIAVGSYQLTTYTCNIKTKYYENSLSFVPFDGDVSKLSPEVLKMTEAFIVFFDSKNISFLNRVPCLANVLKTNDVSLGILLTDKLCDESTSGITYKDVKKESNAFFDVIELKDEYNEPHSPSESHQEFKEVFEALRNHIWSNVEFPMQFTNERNNLDVESQLEAFESLLNNIQNFKKDSSTLGRDQVLDQAEKLAEMFTNIINED